MKTSMPRRDFLKGSVAAAGAIGGALGVKSGTVAAVAATKTDTSPWSSDRIGVGVNLEYVRHADKNLAYGVKTAGKLGFKY
ncbi:MAG: hypothetical protein ACPMAQ_15260, partial [Phycisphaerae bacterium]